MIIDGRRYRWMTFLEMRNDKNIMKKIIMYWRQMVVFICERQQKKEIFSSGGSYNDTRNPSQEYALLYRTGTKKYRNIFNWKNIPLNY